MVLTNLTWKFIQLDSCSSTLIENFIELFLFQNDIALHDSNGVDIISALVVNDINPLAKQRMDLVLELKVSFIICI